MMTEKAQSIPINDSEHVRSSEVIFDAVLAQEKHLLDQWLSWRVKNELVVGIIRECSAVEPLTTTNTRAILANELAAERTRHQQNCTRLENETIPDAQLRIDMPVDAKQEAAFWLKDIDTLFTRRDVHTAMVAHITTIELAGDEGLLELSKAYEQRMFPVAREEVLATLLNERSFTDSREKRYRQLVTSLQHTVGALQSQLEDRDRQLHDLSLNLHLAKHAPDLVS